jgi:hypothetical protein
VAGYLDVSEWGDSRVVMLEGSRLAVGRVSDNDLVLASDPEVSRFHALFESVAGGWCLRDLSSKNGTFVNGERLGGDRPLRSGDVTKEIAAALSISEAAVKQHLLHLYDKFGIYGAGERRRYRLANDAVRRGAVSLADLRRGPQ